MTAIPVGARGNLGSGNPRSGRCPESAARRRHSVYDCGRSGRRRPQMSPGIERCSGGAPGGASAFPQGDADLEPTTAAPPGAPSPRIRRGRETKRRRACPGPRQRIRAMVLAQLKLGCLKSESGLCIAGDPHWASCAGVAVRRTACFRTPMTRATMVGCNVHEPYGCARWTASWIAGSSPAMTLWRARRTQWTLICQMSSQR